MRLVYLVAVLAAALSVGACAKPARVTQMTTSNVAASAVSSDPTLVGIMTVAAVTGGEETNPLWKSEVDNAAFKAALEQSLLTNALLAETPELAGYDLTATLTELEQPFIGTDFTVTSTVIYRVARRSDGALYYEETLTAPYTAKFGDSPYAPERLRLANEGSVKANIQNFLLDFTAYWQANRPAS